MSEILNQNQMEIFNIIKNINKAWLNGKINELRNYFHNNIVMMSPDFASKLTGIEEIVKSYWEFIEKSKIYEFEESDFQINVFDNTAIGTYTYRIIYEINNKKYDGTGREIWTFSKVNKSWFAVWRYMANVVDKEIK